MRQAHAAQPRGARGLSLPASRPAAASPPERTVSPVSGSSSLPSVTVVLVNFNGAQHLPDCLDSLLALDYPGESHELLVVDNASTDASLELLANRYPGVRVLAQDENLGFAGGNNVAATFSKAQCLALLNTDMV